MKIQTKRRKMTHPKKIEIRTRLGNLKKVKVMNSLANQHLKTKNRIKTKIKVMRERVNRAIKIRHKERVPI
jgi:hypothetical protein